MITEQEFLDTVLREMDPDEVVDEFGISTEELIRCLGSLLYRRRYRIAYRFDENELEELDYVSEEDDEEQYSLKSLEEFDDPFEHDD